MQKKVMRKYKRGQGANNVRRISEHLTLNEMFEKFISVKKTEGLATRTIHDYLTHFEYFKSFLGEDLSRDEITLDIFRDFVSFMLHEKELSPVTANVRIRTMRAFIRFCFLEGFIDTPIHENFKPVKTPIDTIESLTP